MDDNLFIRIESADEIGAFDNGSRQGVKTLNRANLSAKIYKNVPRLSRADSRRLVDEVLEEICLALEKNQKVKLRGFGVFRVLNKNARPGRNPKTKEYAVITARRVVSFIPGPGLRRAVDGLPRNAEHSEHGAHKRT